MGASMLAKVAPKASLTLTVPQWMRWRPAWRGRYPGCDGGVEAVVTLVGERDGLLLGRERVDRDVTGPKVSSPWQAIAEVTPSRMVGS